MNRFHQRSSWPSNLLTGLIGWIGWIFIGPLIFGITADIKTELLIAVPSAIVQVVVLRRLFFILQMHRHLLVGISWGLASAIALYFAAVCFRPELKEHMVYWLLIYAYIGAPVGGFLSYFYRDDRKLHEEQKDEKKVSYGRDAHWLEPFGFGVGAYLLAFLPFTNLQFALNVIIAGAVSGVAAAGASHFSPDKWKRYYGLLVLLVLVPGTMQGLLTGLLFRNYGDALADNYMLKGAAGGVITYLITFLRGRRLAYKEEKGLL